MFVAVVPPAEVLDAVDAAVVTAWSAAADLGDALRWTRRDQWHLTLAFYAAVEDRQVDDLRRRLGRAAARHDALDLRLVRAGRFDGRVLWLGVTGARTELARLAATTVAAGSRAGIDVEDRAYRPHLTIARARRPVDLRPVAAALEEWSSPTWQAREIVLLRSHLGARPSYEEYGRWSLRAPQSARLP